MLDALGGPKGDACVFCGHSFASDPEGRTTTHVCAKCGAPQPVSPAQDYFSLLGVKRGFRQNLPDLETKFYAISRALHPDRFAAGPDTKWKVISVERMSAVNRAYHTLTKADALRAYLLELAGLSTGEMKAAIPAELAEEWFELQDAVMEDPSEAIAKLGDFERDLKVRSADLAAKIEAFENDYDNGTAAPTDTLRKIEKLVLDGQYLKSMERDLRKLKSRLGI
jgi:DnaJ-domain-containing protein 1